ncbi:hypothetical protein [Parasutterella sp.]|uniref:hypothetical protein n=1 Tax=Parasutterella sp. TaxID=2049037 RepID=UPI00352237CD
MKRLVLIASLLGFAVCMNPAIAKDTSEHLTAQQNKMSYCTRVWQNLVNKKLSTL